MLTSPAYHKSATALSGRIHEWKLLSCPTPPWEGIVTCYDTGGEDGDSHAMFY